MTTGADLVTRIEQRADQLGQPLTTFARPLSWNTKAWLNSLRRSANPLPHTIERVTALLAGEPVPPPSGQYHRVPTRPATAPAPAPAPAPGPTYVHRDPCPRCGTRADIGCKHQQVAA